jgi:hypothetical protein
MSTMLLALFLPSAYAQDRTRPTITSFNVNGDIAYIGAGDIPATLTATDNVGVTEMCFAETLTGPCTAWTPYSTTPTVGFTPTWFRCYFAYYPRRVANLKAPRQQCVAGSFANTHDHAR